MSLARHIRSRNRLYIWGGSDYIIRARTCSKLAVESNQLAEQGGRLRGPPDQFVALVQADEYIAGEVDPAVEGIGIVVKGRVDGGAHCGQDGAQVDFGEKVA